MSESDGASAVGRENATSLSPSKHDWDVMMTAARTRAIDRPLEDDPAGNAIVGLVAAGWGAALDAAAEGAAAREIATAAGEKLREDALKGARKYAAGEAKHELERSLVATDPDEAFREGHLTPGNAMRGVVVTHDQPSALPATQTPSTSEPPVCSSPIRG